MTSNTSVITQAEWMTHYIGQPLPAAEHIWTLDSPRGAVVFFVLSDTKELNVLLDTNNGGHEVINLSQLWSLTSPIVAVTATDDDQGLIYLAFAMGSTSINIPQTTFATLPIPFDSMHIPTVWQHSLIRLASGATGFEQSTIQGIFVNKARDGQGYPEIIVNYKTTDKNKVARMVVNLNLRSFTISPITLQPEPRQDAPIFVAPGTLKGARGSFYCYKTATGPFLTWAPFMNPPSSLPSFECDSDITGIQVQVESDGNTNLITSSTVGLRWYNASELEKGSSSGNYILYSPATRLRVVSTPALPGTTDSRALIWTVLNDNTLGYLEMADNYKFLVSWTPVVKQQSFKTSSVTASINFNGTVGRVMYIDNQGNIEALEQSSAGIWKPKTLSVVNKQTINTMSCYVSHVKLLSDIPGQTALKEVILSCSSSVTVLVNDELKTIDQHGTVVTTDCSGQLEIVNLIEGLDTPTLFISNSTTLLLQTRVQLDPAKNVKTMLENKSTESALRNAKTASGISIFPTGTNFTKLSQILTSLSEHMKTLPVDGSEKAPPDNSSNHHWGLFHGVHEAVERIEDIALEAERLVIRVGSETFKFLVNSFEKVLRGITSIFKKVGATLEHLIHFLGFVFDWTSILATKKSLSDMVLFAGKLKDQTLDDGFTYLDTALANLKENISGHTFTSTNMQGANARNSMESSMDQDALNKNKQQPVTHHTGIDYFMGKLKNLYHPDAGRISDLDGIDINVWSTTILNIFKPLEGDLTQLLNDLKALVGPGHTGSIWDCIQKIGKDVMITFIDLVRAILQALLPTLKTVYRSFLGILSTEINIPFLTALYKDVVQSNPTLLDVLTLIIAIPATILMKLSGKAVPNSWQLSTLQGYFPNAYNSTPSSNINNGESIMELSLSDRDSLVAIATVVDDPPTNGPGSPSFNWVYNTLLPNFLAPYSHSQAYVNGALQVLISVLTVPTILEGTNTPGVPDPEANMSLLDLAIGFFTVSNSFLSIPVIEEGQWDQTSTPELRFFIWGADITFGLLDIMGSEAKARNQKLEPAMALLSATYSTVLFLGYEMIAKGEVAFTYSTWTSTTTDKRHNLGAWLIPEVFAQYIASLGAAFGPFDEDPNSRYFIAAGSLLFGGLTGYSGMLRDIVLGDTEETHTAI